MKRWLSAVICVLMIFPAVISVRAGEIECSARAFELYCAENGCTLLSDNAGQRLPMASTTKIMTTLITLEEAAVSDRVVTFTEEMTAEGSSMYLQVGEQVRLYDLAVGMMMQSGNDAANAAAIAISGSIEAFADRMNEKARLIGMQNTHFVTPSGLDDDEHYSTAHDMALLMAYALNNEDFAAITAQTSMTVDFTEPPGKRVTYPNHNRLLKMSDSCIGGKTGYTDQSGRCLVSAARRDGLTLIAVTLDAPDDWNDHLRLYEEGFARYCLMQPEVDYPDRTDIVGSDQDTISLQLAENPIVIPRDRQDDVKRRLIIPSFAYAPVRKGGTAGRIVYTLDGDVIGGSDLVYAGDADVNPKKRSFISYIKDLFKWHS